MAEVESFALDHTKVRAPYVRLAGRKPLGGGVVEKYDLRLAQPNREAIPTASLHTLEHLLAGYLRDHLEGVIDLSPMGCRTGFYLVAEGPLGRRRFWWPWSGPCATFWSTRGPSPGRASGRAATTGTTTSKGPRPGRKRSSGRA